MNFSIYASFTFHKTVLMFVGYSSATVLGHDWGGAITWLFASYYPDMCDQVIIMNCPHPIVHRQHMTSSFKQFLASWLVLLLAFYHHVMYYYYYYYYV